MSLISVLTVQSNSLVVKFFDADPH